MLKKCCIKVLKIVFKKLPVKKNKIILSNFFAQGYGDNPKYITEELLRRNKNIKIIWLLNNTDVELDNRIEKVKYPSVRAIYEYSTSKIIVQNIRNFHLNKKRKNQIYIQTWHGGGAFKFVEGDAYNKLSSDYVKEAQYDGLITDAIIAESQYATKMFKRAFWLNKKTEILEYGSPNYDVLIENKNNEKKIKELKEKYNYINDYTVLYAPTFRDNNSTEGYLTKFDNIIKSFQKITNKNVKIIVRFHPNVNDKDININYNNQIIKSSVQDDVKDLALICDSIISDYSSVMYDFLLLDKPVFRYVYDLEKYKKMRGLPDEINDYPFITANNLDMLCDLVSKFNMDNYIVELKKYKLENENFNKGDASYKTVDWILSKMNNKKI